MALPGQPRLGGPGSVPPPRLVSNQPPGMLPGQTFIPAAAPPTGLIGSEQALQGGLTAALAGLSGGIGQGRSGLLEQVNQGTAGFQPFLGAGQDANQRQAALSGALGPEAQRMALQAFMDSPGQSFLREQGDRAITRNAAATGGLGGGRVLQELQRQGIGLAAQDFQNQFDRLGQVAGRGLQAAGGIGQLRGLSASELSRLGLQGGLSAAELARGTGRDLSLGRTRAGEQIAGAIGGATSALSNLINQQGGGLSSLLGSTGGNLAQLLSGAGQAQAGGQMDLAQLLARIAQLESGQAAGLPGVPGVQQTQGIAGGLADLAGGIGGAIALSDRRLKTNIQRVGETPGGTSVYTWDWTATGARIAGGQPTIGVMAQDVPEAAIMGADGYLRVDYRRVS